MSNDKHDIVEDEFLEWFMEDEYLTAYIDLQTAIRNEQKNTLSIQKQSKILLKKIQRPIRAIHNKATAKKCESCFTEFDKTIYEQKESSKESQKDNQNVEDIIENDKAVLNMRMDDMQKSQLQWEMNPRDCWNIGDNVNIYSISFKKWYKGKIINIYFDKSNIEWLTVKYGTYKTTTKNIQRHSQYIAPIEFEHSVTKYIGCNSDNDNTHNFMSIFTTEKQIQIQCHGLNGKKQYFIQILSILHDRITVRYHQLNASKVMNNHKNTTFVIKDTEKNYIFTDIIIGKTQKYGEFELCIDNCLTDSYRIAIYDETDNRQLSNYVQFTKYRKYEYAPPKPIDIKTVKPIIDENNNQILIYWNTPNETYGNNISYKIIYETGKNNQIIQLLPYTISLSNFAMKIKIQTITTVTNENNKIEQLESKLSEFICIENIILKQLCEIRQELNNLTKNQNNLNQRICRLEEFVKQRIKYNNKLKQEIDNMSLTIYEKDLLQTKINNIYENHKYKSIFFNVFVEKVIMAFYDAKIIKSEYIDHQKLLKPESVEYVSMGVESIGSVLEYIFPFVAAFVNYFKKFKTCIEIGNDILILQLAAKNITDFEIKYCKDNDSMTLFAKKMCLKIIETEVIKTQLQNKYYEINITNKANEYSEYFLLLISTGYANEICSILSDDKKYINILSLMVILQNMKTNKISFEQAWNDDSIIHITSEINSQTKDLIAKFYQEFGTRKYLQRVVNGFAQNAKRKLNGWRLKAYEWHVPFC